MGRTARQTDVRCGHEHNACSGFRHEPVNGFKLNDIHHQGLNDLPSTHDCPQAHSQGT
jgi:hypothetical protein